MDISHEGFDICARFITFTINRISINDSIEPTKDDLIAVAVKAGLNKKEAEVIHSEIEETVKKFRK